MPVFSFYMSGSILDYGSTWVNWNTPDPVEQEEKVVESKNIHRDNLNELKRREVMKRGRK